MRAGAEYKIMICMKKMKKSRFFILLAIVIFVALLCSIKLKNMNNITRYPAQAGRFYSRQTEELRETVNNFLAKAEKEKIIPGVKGLVVPHAGYIFSGPVAASAFASLSGQEVGTVILLGNSHTNSFPGIAVDDSDIWLSPLGEVEVNKKLAKKIVKEGDLIFFDRETHKEDHVLEVELPFLQATLKEGFKIVPLIFGNQEGDYQKLASILSEEMGEEDILVVSSDMSHYPSYEDANRIDTKTLELIKDLDIKGLEEHIKSVMSSEVSGEQTLLCGSDAVKTIMALADIKDWNRSLAAYANSGDSQAGDKQAVVGYGAMIFHSDELLDSKQRSKLMEIAKKSVGHTVKTGMIPADPKIDDERLKRKEGAFVTLRKDGKLRGCIGHIVSPDTPLWKNVRDMAASAALEDGRFLPVNRGELNDLEYEISVLSAPKEIEDWRDIKLGKHGVIVGRGPNKGVFLPQVAHETGWDREQFLTQLCSQKAGLPPDCYKNNPEVKLEIFTAQVFSEKDI